eukprot:8155160-Pyramimonas_sp.AAC.2
MSERVIPSIAEEARRKQVRSSRSETASCATTCCVLSPGWPSPCFLRCAQSVATPSLGDTWCLIV